MPEATVSEGQGLRQCPTRIDGAPALIAQSITLGTCQGRQRGFYHKCFACVHANGRVPRVEPAPRAHGGRNGVATNGHATNGHRGFFV